MKLKDILKTDTDNTGWLKTFKKLGADREMLQYINNNISKGDLADGGGSSSKYAPRYFSIDWDKVDNSDETWSKVFEVKNDIYISLQCFSTLKIKSDNHYVIDTYGAFIVRDVIAFSYIPCYISDYVKNELGFPYSGILSFEQCIECINTLLSQLELPILTLNGITEITKEEFYTL